jgi:aerobic-type carbon monoxide dehydrogenase small subunit (CoxS/CutS family)
MTTLTVNGERWDIDVDPTMPLLYVLRNDLKLNAAKFGCGLGQCGACTVLVDNEPVFSCVTPVLHLEGKPITTGRPRHDRQACANSASVYRGAGGTVRLLHSRHDDARTGSPDEELAPE